MKVTLINYTGRGAADPAREAANQLIFTKSTRLQMSPGLMEEIERWPWPKVMAELEYMSNTIPSSWEFVDYTFLIEGVTRGFTHQFVRSRNWSFAQQTMRVLDVSEGPGWSYGRGPSLSGNDEAYDGTMTAIAYAYRALVRKGVAIEDARGILPTNILTNIVGKGNLRGFCELVRKRSSSRTQGEYRNVLDAMKDEVVRVHPWSVMFIERTFDRAANELEAMILAKLPPCMDRTDMIKLIDQMRGAA
jgi:flavin-dependent thymidylate synthase